MTARDRWTVDLKCAICGAEGEAKVSQADGWEYKNDQTTRVDHTPQGWEYRQASHHDQPTFHCAKCEPL